MGSELVGQKVNHNERVITIDEMLVADVFVPELHELMSHYEVRSEYSRQIGEALAATWDQHVLQVGVNGARASATVSGLDGGTQLVNSGYATTGSTIASGLFDAAQALDEHNIPEPRYGVFRPAQYYLMAQTTDVINRDWGGRGVYAEGTVLKVAGVSVQKSNNLPSTLIASGPAAYQGDFSNTFGLIWNPMAMGTVKLRDMATIVAPDPRRIGTLIYGKMAIGSDYLRPETVVELANA